MLDTAMFLSFLKTPSFLKEALLPSDGNVKPFTVYNSLPISVDGFPLHILSLINNVSAHYIGSVSEHRGDYVWAFFFPLKKKGSSMSSLVVSVSTPFLSRSGLKFCP